MASHYRQDSPTRQDYLHHVLRMRYIWEQTGAKAFDEFMLGHVRPTAVTTRGGTNTSESGSGAASKSRKRPAAHEDAHAHAHAKKRADANRIGVPVDPSNPLVAMILVDEDLMGLAEEVNDASRDDVSGLVDAQDDPMDDADGPAARGAIAYTAALENVLELGTNLFGYDPGAFRENILEFADQDSYGKFMAISKNFRTMLNMSSKLFIGELQGAAQIAHTNYDKKHALAFWSEVVRRCGQGTASGAGRNAAGAPEDGAQGHDDGDATMAGAPAAPAAKKAGGFGLDPFGKIARYISGLSEGRNRFYATDSSCIELVRFVSDALDQHARQYAMLCKELAGGYAAIRAATKEKLRAAAFQLGRTEFRVPLPNDKLLDSIDSVADDMRSSAADSVVRFLQAAFRVLPRVFRGALLLAVASTSRRTRNVAQVTAGVATSRENYDRFNNTNPLAESSDANRAATVDHMAMALADDIVGGEPQLFVELPLALRDFVADSIAALRFQAGTRSFFDASHRERERERSVMIISGMHDGVREQEKTAFIKRAYVDTYRKFTQQELDAASDAQKLGSLLGHVSSLLAWVAGVGNKYKHEQLGQGRHMTTEQQSARIKYHVSVFAQHDVAVLLDRLLEMLGGTHEKQRAENAKLLNELNLLVLDFGKLPLGLEAKYDFAPGHSRRQRMAAAAAAQQPARR